MKAAGQYSGGTKRPACDKGGKGQNGRACEEGSGNDRTGITVPDFVDSF